MSVAAIREKLHHEIETGDERLLRMITAIIEQYRVPEVSFGAERDKKIAEERAKHLCGESRSYSPEEVRQMALSKTRPHEL